MDKEALLASLANTLDANHEVRKQSEQKLRAYEELPGFTAYLLDLVVDPSISFGVQVSAAIFFKNRVSNFWVVPELKGRPVDMCSRTRSRRSSPSWWRC